MFARSLLVTAASRAEAVIAECNAESLLHMSICHIVIFCFLFLSYHSDNGPPPFSPARAHWIRAISKVRLQLQEVGWRNASLLCVSRVLDLWLKV